MADGSVLPTDAARIEEIRARVASEGTTYEGAFADLLWLVGAYDRARAEVERERGESEAAAAAMEIMGRTAAAERAELVRERDVAQAIVTVMRGAAIGCSFYAIDGRGRVETFVDARAARTAAKIAVEEKDSADASEAWAASLVGWGVLLPLGEEDSCQLATVADCDLGADLTRVFVRDRKLTEEILAAVAAGDGSLTDSVETWGAWHDDRPVRITAPTRDACIEEAEVEGLAAPYNVSIARTIDPEDYAVDAEYMLEHIIENACDDLGLEELDFSLKPGASEAWADLVLLWCERFVDSEGCTYYEQGAVTVEERIAARKRAGLAPADDIVDDEEGDEA